jgi:hypothetical protein
MFSATFLFLFVRELDFSACGGILVTRTKVIREFQFPNQLKRTVEKLNWQG